ncbi:MutS domain V [Filimonas lacunae]|uniref:MutS domain V n=1 Tax=Filimonas lacunae TaxID=477680 RepID=A0A173MAY1_9BACT|nr:MutS family DNA mismatch repair protein [Filimonas lacunae]BAV04714.1 MutS-related protein, family 1 [Filimonas lacunae]SIT32309.1 MutS domain V [Filimonas lacunae]
MNTIDQPAAWYQQQLQEAETLLNKHLQIRKRLGWIRLACLLVPALLAYLFLPHQTTAAVISILAGIVSFLAVLSRDLNNDTTISYLQRRIHILNTEIGCLNNQFNQLDGGKQWEPAVHPYANDMDIFGSWSLFQYINRCESEQGKQLMAQHLLQPLPAQRIPEYQQAIQELSKTPEWRQQLQNYAQSAAITQHTEQRVKQWLEAPETLFNKAFWKIVLLAYPIIPLSLVGICIAGIININELVTYLFLLIILTSLLTRRISIVHAYVSRIMPEISALQLQLQHIEQQQWQAPALQQTQQLIQSSKHKAAAELLLLKNLLNRFDFRLNVMVIPFLNAFLMWDIRQVVALQQWKQRNKEVVANWYQAIAQIEVYNTIATLHFNHPKWSMPQLATEYFTLTAEQLGHPLIAADKRVNNSVSINGTGQIMLITGSNMAGKSTFLRSLGVNTILAMMGAPVCAKSFTLSPIHLVTSMRIADNLAENTSTFYAELKKLKQIIEQVNNHEQIFVLLDEILRGTNSLDRHTGSKALIQQMIQEKAIAVVATHDVELAALQQQHQQAVHNYHFDVQVEGEELYFDYKLKRGVCQSMNASILMKKIGINVNA